MFGYTTIRTEALDSLKTEIKGFYAQTAEVNEYFQAIQRQLKGLDMGKIGPITRDGLKDAYETIAPVMGVINYIADGVGDVSKYIELRDIASGNYIEKHWLLDLLNRPNDRFSRRKFFQAWAINRLLFGDAFVYAPRQAGKDGDVRDNWYLTDKRWTGLLSRFRKYGVTLGLHTSYAAGGDMSTVSTDVSAFNRTIEQSNNRTIYSRHHFLRMTDPSDFRYLESAGVTDDFSVGYADVAGFRVGTCRPYRWIDPRTGTVGKLVAHPLTIMECTLDGFEYMGLDRESASAYCQKLIERVAVHGGECVLLWHNTSLMNSIQNWQRELYVQCSQVAMKWI